MNEVRAGDSASAAERVEHSTRIRKLLLPAALMLLVVSCQSEEELSLTSTCLEFVAAPYESQVAAVRELGSAAGWQGAVRGQSELRVAQSCNSPERDPGEVTLQQIFGLLARVDADPDPDIAAAEDAGLFGTPRVEGSPLPPHDREKASDSAVGSKAPNVDGTDFEGDPTRIGDTGVGQVVVVTAPWSPVGQLALSELAPDFAALVDDGDLAVSAVITGMSADRAGWPPDEWMASFAFPGDVLVDDEAGSVAAALGVSGLPSWLLIDDTGTVISRATGGLSRAEFNEFTAELD